ncbi:hypothetical protein HGM15179_020811, partial [Zosterops borbonicus]
CPPSVPSVPQCPPDPHFPVSPCPPVSPQCPHVSSVVPMSPGCPHVPPGPPCPVSPTPNSPFFPGLGWSFAFTSSLGAVSGWFPRCRALATGLAVSGAAVSGPAVAPLVPLALQAQGWRGALLLLAALALHMVPAGALLRPPRDPPSPVHPPLGLTGLLHHGPFLRYSLAFALLDGGYYVPFVHLAGHALELGLGRAGAALAVGAMAVSDGLGRLMSGWAAGRPSASLPTHLAAWTALTAAVAPLFPVAGGAAALVTLAAIYGFCAGAVATLQFSGVAEVAGAGREGLAIGVMQMVESVGSLAGPPLAGWLRDVTGDFGLSFVMAGAFLMSSCLLILTLPREPRPGPPRDPQPPPFNRGVL